MLSAFLVLYAVFKNNSYEDKVQNTVQRYRNGRSKTNVTTVHCVVRKPFGAA